MGWGWVSLFIVWIPGDMIMWYWWWCCTWYRFWHTYCRNKTAATCMSHFMLGRCVRLRWVWYRYPFLGLLMTHVLVVTHSFGCVEIERIASFLSWHERDWAWGSLPRPETPGFPSKIRLPSNTNTIPIACAQVITDLSRILKAIPLQQPTLVTRIFRNMGNSWKPRFHELEHVSKMRFLKTHSHTSERLG